MDGLEWKALLKRMIWGYPYFWKHPSVISVRMYSIPFIMCRSFLSIKVWISKQSTQCILNQKYADRNHGTLPLHGIDSDIPPKNMINQLAYPKK